MVVEADVSKELEVLRGDLGKLRHDVAELMETIRYNVGNRMQAARAGASEETKLLGKEVREVVHEAQERGRKVFLEVEHRVQERPVVSLMTALGVGILLGMITDQIRLRAAKPCKE